jgi:hypothetical protein
MQSGMAPVRKCKKFGFRDVVGKEVGKSGTEEA